MSSTSTPSPKLTDEQLRLVETYRSFARNVATQVIRKVPIEREDAIQAAMVGLVQAAGRFDVAKHDPSKSSVDEYFKSFAYPRIRGSVIDQARRDSFVRRRGLERGVKFNMVSLDKTIERGDGGSDLPVVDLAAITGDPDLKIDFERALGTLTDRERHVVLSLAVGARGWELAEELSVTESRISQISTEARKKLLKEMGYGEDL